MRRVCRWLVVAGTFALAAASVRAEEANKEDHDALRRMRKVFEEAVANNEMGTMEPFLSTNFSIVTFTDREFTNFPDFVTQWRETRGAMLGAKGSYRVDLNPEYSLLLDDIAICRGNASNVMVDARGNEFRFNSHWTAVCRKEGGEWKVVRGHNSLNPFFNPMLAHGVQGMLIKIALLAFLMGLAFGLLIMWRLRRKAPPAGTT